MSEIFILEQLHSAGPLLKVYTDMYLVAHLARLAWQWIKE